jgi:hypothetical protein
MQWALQTYAKVLQSKETQSAKIENLIITLCRKE